MWSWMRRVANGLHLRGLPSGWGFATAVIIHSAASAGTIAQTPLFLTTPVKPMVMLVMSKDHQLFYKAYNDYSDLDPEKNDGIETTYKSSFKYYGYFDSRTCYNYASLRFVPVATTDANYYCNGYWSGNFLNWVTMSRMDVVRKLLYGGQRTTDNATQTVLERAYLPTDAHSWVKYYDRNDINKLVPSSVAAGSALSFCNTTHASSSSAKSQDVTDPPLMLVARGNYSLWSANERWQCYWSQQKTASNSNNSSVSGISAQSGNPSSSAPGSGTYVVRAEVCGSTLYGDESDTCYRYLGGNRKPIGLLQQYAERIQFGLMTGSYKKNISGSVLRKKIDDFTNEVNSADGTFTNTPRIVSSLNKLRIYGYNYGDGTYLGSAGDNCDFQLTDIAEGSCTSWGNPISEMFLETLRYFSGASRTSTYHVDPDHLSLSADSWSDPLSQTNACAVLNTVVFNASISSYDGDGLGGFSGISGGQSLSTLVDNIGNKEGVSGKNVFVGKAGSDDNQLCTAKQLNNLSSAEGVCPEAPTQKGTYNIAGLAHSAHTKDLRSGLSGKQTVKTFGVALSPTVPRINVTINGKTVTILPAYILKHPVRGTGAGTLVDFKVVSQTATSGKFYVNWEDSEQGGDYDQDMWGLIEYTVENGKLRVTTDAIAQSSVNPQGFGYIISGTTQDGFHAHSGIYDFDYVDATEVLGCNKCKYNDPPTSHLYTVGSGSAKLIEQPLYYAAKWGGFEEDKETPGVVDEPDKAAEWDANNDGQPDSYFFVTNPSELATSLGKVFSEVEKKTASASAVAANSTSLQTGTRIFQAQFDSDNWSGDVRALPVNADGSIGAPVWSAAEKLNIKNPNNRVIITLYNGQKTSFRPPSADLTNWINYVRGDHSNEVQSGGIYRDRDSRLGDIVNSAPAFVDAVPPFNYPATLESSPYSSFVNTVKMSNRAPMVYVGANDGMLHGFHAETGEELIAYVPGRVINGLDALTKPAYNQPGNHRYFVDGPPTVGDAFVGGQWRTILVSGLGAGGQGLFALDVTNPGSFSEANAAQIVKWEFTDVNDKDLGYTIGQPAIVKMQNGEWVAIVGNGYNNRDDDGNRSSTGYASLFVIRLSDGALRKISTDVGDTTNPNGLATPAAVDSNGDHMVDIVYAGDLRGNLWKFDLSSSDPTNWKTAFTASNKPAPLFKATDGANAQPITVRPDVSRKTNGQPGFMVYFGTGSYFEDRDKLPTPPTVKQSFYGIWDLNDGTNNANRATNLVKQEVKGPFGIGSNSYRVVTDNSVDWSTKRGWYLDLPTAGERVVADAIFSNGRVIFVTSIPSQTPCEFGGTGWIMEVDANNGGIIEKFTFDVNNDGVIDANDLVTVTDVRGDSALDTVAPSGRQSSTGLIQKPTIIGTPASDIEYKYSSGSKDAGIEAVRESKGGGVRGRVSWEQLR